MPIIRNPFRKAPGDHAADENAKPTGTNGFTAGGLLSRRSDSDSSNGKPMIIEMPQESPEYKLCEINDSGVYLPPSPAETKSFWSLKSSSSRRSSHNHRNALNENEPFNISRESFDSYRRSFDISARSPVLESSPSHRSRQSLDARNFRFPSTQSFSTQASFTSMRSHSLSQHPSQRSVTTISSRYTAEPTSPVTLPMDDPMCSPDGRTELPPTAEDAAYDEEALTPPFTGLGSPIVPPSKVLDTKDTIPEPDPVDRFEDVALHDPKPKKHGLLSRFGVGSGSNTNNTEGSDPNVSRPSGTGSHGFFGRKRGGSGQGSELGNMKGLTSRGPTVAAIVDKGLNTRPRTPLAIDKGPFARPRTPNPAERNVQARNQTPVQPDKLVRPATPVAADKVARPKTPVPATATATATTTAPAPTPASVPASTQAQAKTAVAPSTTPVAAPAPVPTSVSAPVSASVPVPAPALTSTHAAAQAPTHDTAPEQPAASENAVAA